MHWGAYRKLRKQLALEVLLAAGRPKGPPLEHALMLVQRCSASAGLDWDNAYGGLKPLLDCLVESSARNPDGLGFIKNDAPACLVTAPLLIQERAPRGNGSTTVLILVSSATTPLDAHRQLLELVSSQPSGLRLI